MFAEVREMIDGSWEMVIYEIFDGRN